MSKRLSQVNANASRVRVNDDNSDSGDDKSALSANSGSGEETNKLLRYDEERLQFNLNGRLMLLMQEMKSCELDLSEISLKEMHFIILGTLLMEHRSSYVVKVTYLNLNHLICVHLVFWLCCHLLP